jgi:hypothetical protein
MSIRGERSAMLVWRRRRRCQRLTLPAMTLLLMRGPRHSTITTPPMQKLDANAGMGRGDQMG